MKTQRVYSVNDSSCRSGAINEYCLDGWCTVVGGWFELARKGVTVDKMWVEECVSVSLNFIESIKEAHSRVQDLTSGEIVSLNLLSRTRKLGHSTMELSVLLRSR
ncbi:hypothetical protein Tco_1392089 [Tanacetum coccineum]